MKIKEKIKLLKLCWKTFIKLLYYKSDDYRQSLVDTIENLEDSENIVSRFRKCSQDSNEMLKRLDWVDVPGRLVVVAEKPGTEDFSYESNDTEYDIHFRNTCKDVIRKDLFNRIGLEMYNENLQEFEPDLFNAFIELDYNMARADYAEAELDYTRSINSPQMYNQKSQYFLNLWNVCQQKKQIFEEQRRIFETANQQQ